MTCKNIFIKTFHFTILSVFLISHSWGSFVLDNDEIRQTHRDMAVTIKNAYQTLPNMFDKFNNLCTITAQFVYKNNEEIFITEPNFELKSDNKIVITSSSSIESLYDDTHNNSSSVLSWPFLNENKFRSMETTKKDTAIFKRLFDVNKNNLSCAQTLNLSLEKYDDLLKTPNHGRNPIYHLKTQYNIASYKDMKHAEPLSVWWLDRHINSLKKACLNKLREDEKKESDNENVVMEDENNMEILYPVIHFYTRRQTCTDCENLIQKSAKKFGYIPIISFSDLYLTEKSVIGSIPCKSLSNGKDEYMLPFSKLKNNFLDINMLEQLTLYSKPRTKRFYLKKLYNVEKIEESIDKEFIKKTVEELIDLDNFSKTKKRLKGIKRFPLQFYTSIN